MKAALILFAVLTTLVGIADAKCQPSPIQDIAGTTQRAEIVSAKPGEKPGCILEIDIGERRLSGITESMRFCRSEIHSMVVLKIGPLRCCDEPEVCPQLGYGETVFIDPLLTALQQKRKCQGKTKTVPYLFGIPSPEMMDKARRGEGMILGTDVGEPPQEKAVICLADRSFRRERTRKWEPLPDYWGSLAK